LCNESFKCVSKNDEIVSSKQKERLLHGKEWTGFIYSHCDGEITKEQ